VCSSTTLRIRNGDPSSVVRRMNELAERHPRYGYRRIWALLRGEGFVVNRKRIERLWRLTLQATGPDDVGPMTSSRPVRLPRVRFLGIARDELAGGGVVVAHTKVVGDLPYRCPLPRPLDRRVRYTAVAS
jgi:putative transposase